MVDTGFISYIFDIYTSRFEQIFSEGNTTIILMIFVFILLTCLFRLLTKKIRG